MRIVLDTNVLVSGLLSLRGYPSEILRLVLVGRITLLTDVRILEEYHEVLSRPKFAFDPEQIGHILEFIEHSSYPVIAEPLKVRLEDESDMPFAEVAVSGKAEYLITGNMKHYPVKCLPGVKVASPAVFMEAMR